MSKKIVSLVILICVLSFVCLNAFAAGQIDEANKKLNIERLDNDPEKSDIVNAINKDMGGIDTLSQKMDWKDAKKNGEYYKIYQIKDNLRLYNDDKNFEKFFSVNNVMWETPVLSSDGNIVSTIRAVKSEGKWATSGGNQTTDEFVKFYTNPENLLNILNSNNIKPQSVKHARIRWIYIDFFYVKDGAIEYIIPYAKDPKAYQIENLKVYSLNDFMNIIGKQYIDPKAPNKGIQDYSQLKYGGTKAQRDYVNFIITMRIAGIVTGIILVILSIIFVIARRKRVKPV